MSTPKPAVRYAHTNLIAEDWRRLARFYTDVFGCEPVSSVRDHHGPATDALTGMPGARVHGQHLRLPGFGENGPTLEVFEYEQKGPPSPKTLHTPGFAHLAFEVADLAETVRQVLAHGGGTVGKLVTIDIAGAGRLSLVYMTDPEGNIIELQQWH
jgi:catechol 2,3-dioxygenase-like lactoylglutathione lyase family enzyme